MADSGSYTEDQYGNRRYLPGWLAEIDLATGSLARTFTGSLNGAISQPGQLLVAGGYLFVQNLNGDVTEVDVSTGSVLLALDPSAYHYGSWGPGSLTEVSPAGTLRVICHVHRALGRGAAIDERPRVRDYGERARDGIACDAHTGHAFPASQLSVFSVC
ncbi:MAG TPA: hypothetical protein VFN61_05890 [Acidimicrobiales bacterium]|nr:hypothetical protein [Acidimicrobiales bacterium]